MLIQLSSHYYRPDFTKAQAKSLIDDMVQDLACFQMQEVEVAIRRYRQDAARKFFPRSADLRELVLADQRERRAGASGKRVQPQFGESRPLMWWKQERRLWRPQWRENEIPAEWKENYFALKLKAKNDAH